MDEQKTDFYEVLDEQGHKTGQILDRETVHKQELWHEVANVWIMNMRGEVLLQLRAPGVELEPNVWDVAVGTHVRPNEDPTLAAQRCLHTELGLEINTDKLRHLFNIQSANPVGNGVTHRTLSHVFLLKRDIDLAGLHFDPTKITQLDWKMPDSVMADIGSSEAAAKYRPRAGDYYSRLFEALLAESQM